MPNGSKLNNYGLLSNDARSDILPGPLQMIKIRNLLMNEPAKITLMPLPEIHNFTNAQWQSEAKSVYKKTKEDV